MNFAGVAVELGVDAGGESVAHQQQRRVGPAQAVGEQLLEGGVQVAAGGLVLPGKVVALEHVGITTGLAQHQGVLLKNVVTHTAGQGDFEQLAQVDKVRLGTLAFVQVGGGAAGAPFFYEFLGGHGQG